MLGFDNSVAGGNEIVGLLDIGTSKVCCLIVALTSPRQNWHAGQPVPARLLGLGHQRSQGIKAGVIDNMEEAEEAVRAAVSQAERMAGVTLDEVIISVSCGRLKSSNFGAAVRTETGIVSAGDIARALAGGRNHAERDGRALVHMSRIGFRLDGAGSIREPHGMSATKLSADVHAVTADETPLRNLLLVIERCHLSVKGFTPSPHASGLAATTEEERRLGVVCIDMGGGTTTFSIFAEGHFLHTDAIAIGGNHLSFDLARSLSTPLHEAERIKTLYGTLVGATSDQHEVVAFPLVGEEEPEICQVSKAQIRQIIEPRIVQILSLIGERIDRCGLAEYANQRVVLTGGAAQLTGLGEFTANHFGRPVRVGRPQPIGGMPESVCSPAFSAVIGLLRATLDTDVGVSTYQDRELLQTGTGYVGRVGQWFRESF